VSRIIAALALALASATASAAPQVEISGAMAGDVCASVRGEGQTKGIPLTITVAPDGRVIHFAPPRRITDVTVEAINAALKACRWQAAPAQRAVRAMVWVEPPGLLF
jgi:hypothetical protein